MLQFLLPLGYTVLLWWLTTGLILMLVGRPVRTFRSIFIAATLLGVGALIELISNAAEATVFAAYAAFTAALVIWGWLEAGFLLGFITGPRRSACPERCGGWPHFWHSAQAVVYHDLAVIAVTLAVFVATWHAPNRVGAWTLLILAAMRLSAKLNLFLGVANLGEQFLPPHLRYLKSFFRRRPMNFLFPLSVSATTALITLLMSAYFRAQSAYSATALALSVGLLGLALLEHWFMVLPLPSERLWNWAVGSRRADPVMVKPL